MKTFHVLFAFVLLFGLAAFAEAREVRRERSVSRSRGGNASEFRRESFRSESFRSNRDVDRVERIIVRDGHRQEFRRETIILDIDGGSCRHCR